MSSQTKLLSLVLFLAAAACVRSPEQRAFEACRAEIARHLVDPTSAAYETVHVTKRSGDGANVVDGWDVEVGVKARTGTESIAQSRVTCTLGRGLELLDLTGEQLGQQR